MSKYWGPRSIENKHKLQNLLFTNGIVIDSEKRQYQTSKVNEIFSLISVISSDSRDKIKDPSLKNSDGSCFVELTEKSSNNLIQELQKFYTLNFMK